MKDVCRKLGEDITNYFSFLSRADEPVIEALERKAESMGVEPYLMKDGGLQVANPDWILGDVVADVVGFAVGTWLDASSGHPHGEGMGVVVSTVEALFQG